MKQYPGDTLDSDLLQIDSLEEELAMLQECDATIAQTSLDRPTIAIMFSTGLLSSTAMENLGMNPLISEAFGEADIQLARESLIGKIGEKAKEWGAKALSVAKSFMERFTGFLKAIWGKITEYGKALGSYTWDKAKDAATYAKAHPYKTILGVVGAVVAVLSIGKLATNGPKIGDSVESMKKFMEKISTAAKSIVSPIGRVFTKPAAKGTAIIVYDPAVVAAPVSKSVGALGWTKSAFSSIFARLGEIWSSIAGIIKSIWEKYIKPVGNVAEKVYFLPKDAGEYVKKKSGSRIAGFATNQVLDMFYIPILMKFAMSVFRVIKDMVVALFRMVADTFRSLTGAVKD